MKKSLVILALFILAAWTVSAQQPIAGSVTDAHGDAVSGAKVTCGSETALTGADGRFELASRQCEKLVVTAGGFETSSIPVGGASNVVLHPSSLFEAVTVAGAETPLAESAVSVAVIPRGSLDTSGTLTLDERLRQVPGFSLFRRAGSRTANPTTQGVSLRGVGASGASRAVALKDGVPLNDPFGSWVYWGRVPSESISEVEIVRGPASDLYGTAAVGGVIYIRTRDIDSPFASFDLGYGSEQTPFGSGLVSSKWREWGGSLAGEYLKTDGFIPVVREQRGAVDTLANVRRSSMVPTIERRFRSDSRVFVSADFFREVRANGTPQQRNDTRMNNFSAGADLSIAQYGQLTLRAMGGAEKYHQSFSAIAANRNSESLNRLQTVPSQSLGMSAKWLLSLGKTTYFAGGEYRNTRGRSDEIGFANGGATVVTSAGGRESSSAGYIGALFRPIRRLTLSGGVRYDRWIETHGFSASRSLVSSASSFAAFPDRRRQAVSPRASALVRINRSISAAAGVARGFRQPTLNELYRSFRVGNVLTLSNENLRAERALNGEAAIIVNAFDERLYVRAGPFCTRVSDTVSNVTLIITPNLITRQRQNLGVTRNCGFESDAVVRLVRSLTLNGGYLHVEARVTEMPGNTPLVGLRLPQVPSDQTTLQARYSPAKVGTFSLQIRSSSLQFDDDLNQLPLKGYVTVDAFASRKLAKGASVYLAAENIFGARIEAGRTPVLTLAQPRTIRVGLRLRVGKD